MPVRKRRDGYVVAVMLDVRLNTQIPVSVNLNHAEEFNQKEKKISITSKQELVYSELFLAVMGISYSVYPLTGYKIYENGEYVAKIKE